jgi:hypothetical protein
MFWALLGPINNRAGFAALTTRLPSIRKIWHKVDEKLHLGYAYTTEFQTHKYVCKYLRFSRR